MGAGETYPPLQATIKLVRGKLQVDWPNTAGMLYLVEESTDLENWRASESVMGDDIPRTLALLPDPTTGGSSPRKFIRVRGLPQPSGSGSTTPR